MARMDVNVSSIDMGWEEFKDKISTASKRPSVTVGVHREDAPRKTTRSNSLNNAELLALHEFGGTFEHPGGTPYVYTGEGVRFVSNEHPDPDGHTDPHTITIPARSILRTAFRGRGAGKLRTTARAAMGRYFDRGTSAFRGLKRAMGRIGKLARSMVRVRMGPGAIVPNAPETIRKKGHARPLIGETLQLRDAIDFQVHLEFFEFAGIALSGARGSGFAAPGQGLDASQFD